MQSMGGKARAASLSTDRLIAIAKKAAKARWKGHVKGQGKCVHEWLALKNGGSVCNHCGQKKSFRWR